MTERWRKAAEEIVLAICPGVVEQQPPAMREHAIKVRDEAVKQVAALIARHADAELAGLQQKLDKLKDYFAEDEGALFLIRNIK